MNGSNSIKLVLLAAGVAVLNIVMLSPGLLGVEIGGDNALQTALGVTVLFMSLLILLYGSYTLLFKRPSLAPVKDLKSREDYITAVQQYRNVKVLKNEMAQALDQLERIEKKGLTLRDVLRQRFEPAELSYRKFDSVITEVEKLFYLNIRGMLNKLGVFSVSDFSNMAGQHQQRSTQRATKVRQQKTALYEEYLAYVTGYLDNNEEILLKLDQLLLEISLLGSIDYKEIDEMPCMKEIDELINQTKLYKQ